MLSLKHETANWAEGTGLELELCHINPYYQIPSNTHEIMKSDGQEPHRDNSLKDLLQCLGMVSGGSLWRLWHCLRMPMLSESCEGSAHAEVWEGDQGDPFWSFWDKTGEDPRCSKRSSALDAGHLPGSVVLCNPPFRSLSIPFAHNICTNKPRIRNLPRIRNKESETKSRESETKIRESETKIPRIRNQKSRESETKMRESETKIRESETENQKLKTANQKLKSRESETKLPRIRNQNPANHKPKTANQKPKPENQKLKNTREQVRFDWGNRQTVTLGLFRHSWVNHILNKQLLNTCHSMKAATLSTSTSLLKKSNPPPSSGHYVE